MAKSSTAEVYGESPSPRRDPSPWSRANGTYVAGRSYIDEADFTASQMEAKWGVGRLRLLVGPELREKFDRQRAKFNHAINQGDLEDVKREAGRMVKGWQALDRAAEAAGAAKLDPQVWETGLADGRVLAIVPDNASAGAVAASGRKLVVYTLAEIAHIVANYATVSAVKDTFPGALVVAVQRDISEPLWGMPNDDLPF